MEIVVALGLVVVMALAIVGIFSRLISRSAISADQAAGQLLAQSVLDKAIRIGPPDWGGLSGSQQLASADQSSKTVFNWTVVARELPRSALDPPPSSSDLGVLYRVRVTVDWSNTSSPGTRQNLGRMMVERSRLSYVEQSGP